MKLVGKKKCGSGKITLEFGVDRDQGADPGIFCLFVISYNFVSKISMKLTERMRYGNSLQDF